MLTKLGHIGIIGGAGLIGRSLAKQLLLKELIQPAQLWISNRSGTREHFAEWPEVHITKDNQELVNQCNTLVLAVRPHHFPALKIQHKNQLVISVMAGISCERIQQILGAKEVVRAMPNAAAEIAESYTVWFANSVVPKTIHPTVQQLFEAIGKADRVEVEKDIDFFTALTGSGEGWIAFLEHCFIEYARKHEVSAEMAERAIRQTFLGVSKHIAQSEVPVSVIVQTMIDYAGTTAAGLVKMESSQIAKEIEVALDASYQKASSDMTKI